MRRRRPPEPFAAFSVVIGDDGTGTVAYEQDGVISLERVASCSCAWVTHPGVERVPDPRCPVPGHAACHLKP